MVDDERPDAPEQPDEQGTPEEEAPEEAAPEEAPTPEEPEGAPAEEQPVDESAAPDEPVEEPTAADEPSVEAASEAAAEPGPEVEGLEEVAEAAEAAEQADAAEEAPEESAPAQERGGREKKKKSDEVIPGADLEPDLVLEDERQEGEMSAAAAALADAEQALAADSAGAATATEEAEPGPRPVEREPLDLAADARYLATGKRKSAVARVILKPGSGTYTVNGRHLDQFFPRIRLQKMARQPLETAGYASRMDVVAKIHGGGVSAQAGALRHGIARALVEADPNLRVELKRRGYLTRDPRVKERKKAGLKKARKRPQFSKR
jgi:small subunit ribosomal protein S9